MKAELDKETVAKAYARWAPVYDLVFGAVFEEGRRAAISATNRIGGRVLDVGVGTGISLPDYAPTTRVVGIDLSEPMLRKAQERVAEMGLRNVECLAVMDAERLAFPDATFDVVVAQYVLNTVPNPEATLNEFARVLRPRGEVVLVNRIGADAGLPAHVRALLRAYGAQARLAVRVSVDAVRPLGRAVARRAPDRASAGAAARPLLADPLRKGCRRRVRLFAGARSLSVPHNSMK